MSPEQFLKQMPYIERELDAWLDVAAECRRLGHDGQVGNGAELTRAITAWGEELAQLRLHDPNPEHAVNALAKARAGAPSLYDRGTYLETPRTEAPAAVARVGRNDPCPCGSGRKAKRCCYR
jgi:SEC-C motif